MEINEADWNANDYPRWPNRKVRLAQSRELGLTIDGVRYAKRMRKDDIRVNRLEAQLRPNPSILGDEDLIRIRLEEDLFEEWRNTVRDSLQAVESYESAMGRTDATAVQKEIRERMDNWSEKRRKGMKSAVLKNVVAVGEGAAVSFVSGLALSGHANLPSLAIGAAYKTIKAGTRLFTWRRRDKLISRHFLSVV